MKETELAQFVHPGIGVEPVRSDVATHLDAIYRSTVFALCHLDGDLRVRRLNDTFAQLVGLASAAGGVGALLGDLDETIAEVLAPHMDSALREGKVIEGLPIPHLAKDENRLPLRWTAGLYPVLTESGRASGVEVLLHPSAADEQCDLLLRTGKILASSLELEKTLDHVAHVLVPQLGDWCVIDLRSEDSTLRMAAVAHVNPEKVALVRELRRRYPVKESDDRGVNRAIRTGTPELYAEVDEAVLRRAAGDNEHLESLRSLHLVSAIIVPLRARSEEPIGAITLASSQSDRRYSREDLRLTEEVAHRAAQAIENARLYERLRQGEEQMRLVMAELNHRVKNTLSAVEAMAHQTLRSSSSLDDFGQSFSERLRALAQAHSLLTRKHWVGAFLHDVVWSELRSRMGSSERVTVEGPSLLLSPKSSLALHMVIHELCTNACKYGSLSNDSGQVSVQWRPEETERRSTLHLTWRETDGPPVAPPRREGFGSRFIRRVVEYELEGRSELDYRATGVRCDIWLPWSQSP